VTQPISLEYEQRRGTSVIYYGWVNLVIAAVSMVATLPGRTQGLGLITQPLLRDLKISPEQFGLQNLWATLIGSTFSLACGPLIDMFGARIVLSAILAALGATVLAMSHVHTPGELLAALILTRGFGQSALSVVSLALVGKWFSRRLPLAMGLYSLLVGIGFVIAFGVVGKSVIASDWRHVWNAIGWSLVILTFIALLATRPTPESIGQGVDGGDGPTANDSEAHDPASLHAVEKEQGFTLGEALATPAFWAYASAASLFGTVSAGLMLFNESVLREHGFDNHLAVNIIIVVTFTGMVANFAGGLMGLKISVGGLMAGAMFLLAFSLVCLPLARGLVMVYSYAVLMGVAGGIVTVAFFTCWGKVFGRKHLGSIQGVAQGLTVVTSSAGPWMLARCVHVTGSSAPLFYILAPVIAALGVFCLLARTPVHPASAA
jgi:MFS family permease